MAAKRFHIAAPEQLRGLSAFVKDGKLDTLASVWAAMKRRNGPTRWDDRIYVGFSGDQSRTAEVVRVGTNDDVVRCATLKYNLALKWCEQHLRRVYD